MWVYVDFYQKYSHKHAFSCRVNAEWPILVWGQVWRRLEIVFNFVLIWPSTDWFDLIKIHCSVWYEIPPLKTCKSTTYSTKVLMTPLWKSGVCRMFWSKSSWRNTLRSGFPSKQLAKQSGLQTHTHTGSSLFRTHYTHILVRLWKWAVCEHMCTPCLPVRPHEPC